jgi:hypothetical protein
MGADVIFAIVADVLGVPTLALGLYVDRRAKRDRQAMHLRHLLVITQNLDRAALRWLALMRGLGLKPLSDVDAERIAEAALLVSRHLDELQREQGATYTPRWVMDLPLYSYFGLTASYVEDELHPSLERAIRRLNELPILSRRPASVRGSNGSFRGDVGGT